MLTTLTLCALVVAASVLAVPAASAVAIPVKVDERR
jgi:hypothetical protein